MTPPTWLSTTWWRSVRKSFESSLMYTPRAGTTKSWPIFSSSGRVTARGASAASCPKSMVTGGNGFVPQEEVARKPNAERTRAARSALRLIASSGEDLGTAPLRFTLHP